jgi:anti-anti-sigma factor
VTTPTLVITSEPNTEGDTIVLAGELDLTSVHLLDDELALTSAPGVVLDLSAVSFLDSAGIRTIDRAHRRLRDDGRSLIVAAPESSRAAWTFRVAGYQNGLVVGSVDEAVDALRRSS